MKRTATLAFCCTLLAICPGSTALAQSLVTAQPLRFNVGADRIEAAWARAHEWIGSATKGDIQVVGDSMIEVSGSHSPGKIIAFGAFGAGKSFGVRVTRVGESKIVVQPKSGNRKRAHYLARYIQTGNKGCLNEHYEFCFKRKWVPPPPEPKSKLRPGAVEVKSDDSCTAEQIASMVKLGLTEEQIRAACEDQP